MKTLVLSGINLHEGGPLSIYKDCLNTLLYLGLQKKYKIIAFIHSIELFNEFISDIEFIELPNSRKNYFYRLFYEYVFFRIYSEQRDIDIWISLHDITPNVKARKVYTYCHNPTPFLKRDWKLFQYSKSVYFMSMFYKYLYRINIYNNNAIIVQQLWLKKEFLRMFPRLKKVIVAKPNLKVDLEIAVKQHIIPKQILTNNFRFIYAAYPRPFKNFEIICEATKMLIHNIENFEVYLTLDGTENLYSKEIWSKYKTIPNIHWLGILPRADIFNYYQISDCMIFPSKLETWGLPISEFQSTGKLILAADLPYAHETVGAYGKVKFFGADNVEQLVTIMLEAITGNIVLTQTISKENKQYDAENWNELILTLFEIGGE